ncbi:uncharacterized protein LOC130820829 isoform X2 [Amaranthus tricolor]|uniref:uncharacterized protein LOC130820829 isoform X2 n=1 Tax=Amaranthus tricolor TaxID=29722 RepID=UPI0025843437|nr:uncharacterized protein LOC130820829 isoform X2 [Amaranthus tricolor]
MSISKVVNTSSIMAVQRAAHLPNRDLGLRGSSSEPLSHVTPSRVTVPSLTILVSSLVSGLRSSAIAPLSPQSAMVESQANLYSSWAAVVHDGSHVACAPPVASPVSVPLVNNATIPQPVSKFVEGYEKFW